MSDEITIRIATASDADALIAFNQSMALETEGKQLEPDILSKGVNAVFIDERKGFYVVAESSDGKVVGGLMITFEWSDWRNQWFWWIQSVYVLPEYRNRGIYRKLYEFVKSKARQEGSVYGFRLYVDKENITAQKVYEKLGMKESHYLMFEEKL